ncbi:nitrogenase component 1 [Enterocloster citroniae]|uniref:nitrogenase component 1 n=1 Tax=Enterocloster citroniae TaxID=358743 RepID=UPI00349EA8B0
MLKDLHEVNSRGAGIEIADVSGLAPFTYGLEYSAPARGGWTIVHIGMLLPESHQVFVCAQSCLRGVVLSAAELNDSHRFSTISVDEDSVLEGDCEEIIIRGVTHILEEMPKLPRALLLFTSCIHHFLGTDMKLVFGELDRRFPQVGFVQCWMNPIMRKTKMPPDPFMRKQLYSLLEPAEISEKQVNIIGNNLAVRRSSELYRILEENGFALKDICTCRDFEEYRTMAEGCLNIVIHPLGRPAAQELEERLGQRWVYLPVSYNWDEISERWKCLSDLLNLDSKKVWRDMEADRLQQAAEHALRTLAQTLSDWSVVIDYTISSRPLGMAKLLVMCGFKVERIYADTISSEEADVLEWLKIHCPRMLVCPTVYHKMAVLPRTFCGEKSGKVLAMGQKAAYFTGTGHFVNMVEDGGLYGYGGILELAGLMEEAAREEKDTEKLIQVKGWGCCC